MKYHHELGLLLVCCCTFRLRIYYTHMETQHCRRRFVKFRLGIYGPDAGSCHYIATPGITWAWYFGSYPKDCSNLSPFKTNNVVLKTYCHSHPHDLYALKKLVYVIGDLCNVKIQMFYFRMNFTFLK